MAELSRKRKLVSTELKVKLEAIKTIENGVRPSVVAKNLNVHIATVKSWLKNRDKLRDWDKEKNVSLAVKRKRMRKPDNDLVDKALIIWYKQQCRAGCPPNGSLLKIQALHFWKALGGTEKFEASQGWLSKWKKRNNIRQCESSEKKLSSEENGTDSKPGNILTESEIIEIVTKNDGVKEAEVEAEKTNKIVSNLRPKRSIANSPSSVVTTKKVGEIILEKKSLLHNNNNNNNNNNEQKAVDKTDKIVDNCREEKSSELCEARMKKDKIVCNLREKKSLPDLYKIESVRTFKSVLSDLSENNKSELLVEKEEKIVCDLREKKSLPILQEYLDTLIQHCQGSPHYTKEHLLALNFVREAMVIESLMPKFDVVIDFSK